MRLLRLSDEEHVVLLTMHHIASDGWSMGVLMRELETLYEAFGPGEASPLPPLPVQYADYARWQRQWLQGEVLERQLGYWRRQLAGLPLVHDLPLDQPRPARQSFEGGEHVQRLRRELRGPARGLLPGARGDAVHGAAGGVRGAPGPLQPARRDIVVGTPIAGRVASRRWRR